MEMHLSEASLTVFTRSPSATSQDLSWQIDAAMQPESYSDSAKHKIKQTNLKRYGGDNSDQLTETFLSGPEADLTEPGGDSPTSISSATGENEITENIRYHTPPAPSKMPFREDDFRMKGMDESSQYKVLSASYKDNLLNYCNSPRFFARRGAVCGGEKVPSSVRPTTKLRWKFAYMQEKNHPTRIFTNVAEGSLSDNNRRLSTPVLSRRKRNQSPKSDLRRCLSPIPGSVSFEQTGFSLKDIRESLENIDFSANYTDRLTNYRNSPRYFARRGALCEAHKCDGEKFASAVHLFIKEKEVIRTKTAWK